MPPGTQVQHWTKELEAKAANLDPAVMNQNLSPLQSRTGGEPTTLLVPRKAGSTVTYTVDGTPALATEHKLADNRVIEMEADKLTQANPGIDPGFRAVESGRSAQWRMTGEAGPAPGPGYGEVVPLDQVLERLPAEASTSAVTAFAKGALNFGVHLGVGILTNMIATHIIAGTDVPMTSKDLETGSTLLSGLPPGVDILAAYVSRGITNGLVDMYKQQQQRNYERMKEQDPDWTGADQERMDAAAAPILGDVFPF